VLADEHNKVFLYDELRQSLEYLNPVVQLLGLSPDNILFQIIVAVVKCLSISE
jgi:hypothetical protein